MLSDDVGLEAVAQHNCGGMQGLRPFHLRTLLPMLLLTTATQSLAGQNLPVVAGTVIRCDQQNNDTPTHHGLRAYAWDFSLSGTSGDGDFGYPLVSPEEGRVVYAKDYASGLDPWGKCVVVRYQDGQYGLLAHLAEIIVKNGEWVSRGQVLGRLGNADGYCSDNGCYRAHIHYQRQNGVTPDAQSVSSSFIEAGTPHNGDTPTSQNSGVFDQELNANGGTDAFGTRQDGLGPCPCPSPPYPTGACGAYAGVHWHYCYNPDPTNLYRENGLPNNCYVQNWDGSTYDLCGIIYDALGGARRAYTVRNGFYHDSNNQGWNDLGGPTSPLGLPITDEYALAPPPALLPTDTGGVQPRLLLDEVDTRQDFQTGSLFYLQGEPNEVLWEPYPTVAPGWTPTGWDKTFSYLMAMAYERNGADPGVGHATGPATSQSFTAGSGSSSRTSSYYVQNFTGGSNGDGMIFYHPENYETNQQPPQLLNPQATNEAYYLYDQFRDFWLSNGGADALGVPTRDRYWDHDPATGDGWYEVQNFMRAGGTQCYMILDGGVQWREPRVVASTILGPNNVNTDPVAALGAPDGTPVSLGAGGEITLDLVFLRPPDSPVQTLVVYEASSSVSGSAARKTPTSTSDSLAEGYAVYGSPDATTWTYLGSGVGRSAFTFSTSPPDARLPGFRYVRIVDDGDGDPNSASPGVDVDAVTVGENIVSGVQAEPCYATAGLPVTISCQVADSATTSVRIFFKVAAAASFDSLTMSLASPNTYSAVLPGQTDQARVLYYVVARDAAGNVVKSPSPAPGFTYSYRVGLQTIASLQVPTVIDSCGVSSQVGKACNVVGVVTHRAHEFSDSYFYIQNGTGPNSGIKVFAPTAGGFVPNLRDSVRVSGLINEFNCQTEVVLFADCTTVLGPGFRVRSRSLSSVSDINKEENESMLVTVRPWPPITVLTGFETTDLGQEFKIGSGADIAYVGDDTFTPDGIGYSIVPEPGMVLDAITGIIGYRDVDTTPPGQRTDTNLLLRLEPRRDNDVDRDWTGIGEPDSIDVVKVFGLHQNAPNPFNPTTTIEFVVPRPGRVALRLYDARGQVVRTLLDTTLDHALHQRVTWDGRDDAGKLVASGVYFYQLVTDTSSATRKMLLLK